MARDLILSAFMLGNLRKSDIGEGDERSCSRIMMSCAMMQRMFI